MAFASPHGVAIVFSCIGMIMIIAAMGTSAWMMGCLSYDNIIAAVKKLLQKSDQEVPANFDQGAAMLSGKQMCIHQGLFKVSMVITGISVNLPISVTSIPMHAVITAMGLIGALACALAAAVFNGMAAAGSRDSYESKSKMSTQTHRATIVLIAAVLLGIGGMTVYTIGTAHVIHQPLQYMGQFGESMMGSFSGMIGGGGGMPSDGSQLGFPGQGRKKRDLDISSLDSTMQEYLTTMVEGMDPVYGSSFIVGWVSIILLVVALGFTILAKRNIHGPEVYNEGNAKI